MDHVENGDIGKCGVYEFGLEITFCHTLLIQAARGEKRESPDRKSRSGLMPVIQILLALYVKVESGLCSHPVVSLSVYGQSGKYP